MTRPRTLALAWMLLGALVLTGCGGNDSPSPAATTPAAKRIADLDTTTMSLVRVAFCDLVPTTAVKKAVGGHASRATSWGNGEQIPVLGGHDLAHEIGCSWAGPADVTAQAWVFARPVTPAFARSLVRADARERGCRTTNGPAFGKPDVAQTCKRSRGATRVRHAGLFGDTWLTCQISGKKTAAFDVRRRADAWCAAVASALNTGS